MGSKNPAKAGFTLAAAGFFCILFVREFVPELLAGFLRPDVFAHKVERDKGGQAAGDLLGVTLFQQGTIGDIGRHNGRQACPQAVVEQAVKCGDEIGCDKLGAQIIQDQ